ncbi:MAG: type II toxin-antitoxin system PrlF family antitoxin [Pseudomonadota bacterium]
MKSAITSKFQTTIPKTVRERLKLSIHDTLEWKIERGRAVVLPLNKPFLRYRNTIKVGAGNIANDIKLARELRIKDGQ